MYGLSNNMFTEEWHELSGKNDKDEGIRRVMYMLHLSKRILQKHRQDDDQVYEHLEGLKDILLEKLNLVRHEKAQEIEFLYEQHVYQS